jgi:hypothetical protein
MSDVHSHLEEGIDTGLWFRFQLPCERQADLLHRAGVEKEEAGHSLRNSDLHETWWRPEAVPDRRTHSILHDEKPPRWGLTVQTAPSMTGTCTVYIEYMTL